MAETTAQYQGVLTLDMSQFTSGMTDANSKWETFTSGLASTASTIATGLAAGLAACTTAVVAFAKSSVEAGMTFDSSMS